MNDEKHEQMLYHIIDMREKQIRDLESRIRELELLLREWMEWVRKEQRKEV